MDDAGSRFYPAPELWPELYPDLSAGEGEVLTGFDAGLPAGWRIYVRPYLNGLRPSVALYHPERGFALYDVLDWDPEAVAFSVRKVSDPDFDDPIRVLFAGEQRLDRMLNPVTRMRLVKQGFGRLVTNADCAPSSYGLITAGVLFTAPGAAEAGFLDLVGSFRTASEKERGISNLVVASFQDFADNPKRVLNRIYGHSGRSVMYDRLRELGLYWLEPEDYFGSSFGFELDSRQRSIAYGDPPAATRQRRARGPAGSGKSFVLTARAAHLALQGKSVLVVCFNAALTGYLRRLVAGNIGAVAGSAVESQLARERVAVHHYHDLRKGSVACRFDAVLVDEGQDFDAEWWVYLRNNHLAEGGEMLLMADNTQDVYNRGRSWIHERMPRNSGFRGGWTSLGESDRLEGNYRLPHGMIEPLRDYAQRFLGVGTEDLPSSFQFPMDARYPLDLRWISVNPSQLVDACVSETLRLASGVGYGMEEVAVLLPGLDTGARYHFALASEWNYPLNTVFPCPRNSDCAEHKHCAFCPGDKEWLWNKRLEFWVDPLQEASMPLKMVFPQHLGALRVSTFESFKGWESRHVLIGFNGLSEAGDRDRHFRRFYVALTRVLRHEKGSSLTVVSADPELTEWALDWFQPAPLAWQREPLLDSLDQAGARFLSREGGEEPLAAAAIARHSLEGLRSGLMPDYSNPAVVLAYAAQYQLRQVNMAYTLFREKMARSRNWSSGLQVIDLGAGTLAGVMGLALAVADLEAEGFAVGSGPIFFAAVEPAAAMAAAGLKFFEHWRRVCQGMPELAALTRAIDRIQLTCGQRLEGLSRSAAAVSWLCSFHALYLEGVESLQRDLSAAAVVLQPDWILLTGSSSKEGLGQAVAEGSGLNLSGPRWGGDWRFEPILYSSRTAAAAARLGLLPERWHRKDRSYCWPAFVLYWERD